MIDMPFAADGHTATTVTTTVWIGVCVVVLLHLRFGWTLSGLVVPGYLVPLIMVRPISVAIIMIESIITYGLVRLLSELGKRHRYGCILFGRDQFFVITLVSVLVRVAMDGWLLPIAGQWLNETFDLRFRYDDELHSIGLVIVALIANYFWKPGVLRGVGPLMVTTTVTYFIVRYGFVEFLSFDIGNLRYVYEDIATSLLASPKAYIVLLTTAWLASHMNLRYAWDYNGILIPSLLALQCCFPSKILATFVESFVILGLAHLVLEIPIFRRLGVVGARQLLLFFTIAFLYRTLLTWIVPLAFEDLKLSDAHGFGYLLSTLLAIRFYSKGRIIAVCQATLQVSVGGALLGSLIGFCLMFVPLDWQPPTAAAAAVATPGGTQHRDLYSILKADKLRLYQAPLTHALRPPSPLEVGDFVRSLRLLKALAGTQAPQQLAHARQLLKGIDYEILELDHFLYLRDLRPERNWGTFALRRDRRAGLLISVPFPQREPFTFEAAASMLRHLDGTFLAIAQDTLPRSGSRPLHYRQRESLYSAFHRELGHRSTLQVRSYTAENASWFADGKVQSPQNARSSLWISRGVPRDLDLARLETFVEAMEFHWHASPLPNPLRDEAPRFAELFLSQRDLTHLYAQGMLPPRAQQQPPSVELSGRLIPWLLRQKDAMARLGTGLYQPPSHEELLFLDREVLQPLLYAASENVAAVKSTKVLSDAASRLNYQVLHFHEPQRKADFLILAERQPPQRFWGTYVFRIAPETPFIWEIPHPLFERNSFEFGVTSFVRHHSRALLVPGAHRSTNHDASADVVPTANRLTLFNLVHQSLILAAPQDPLLVIQCRAIRDPVESDITLACGDGSRGPEEISPLKRELVERLSRDHLSIAFVDGGSETAGYELGNSAQLAAIHFTPHKEFVGLWLASSLRSQFRRQSTNYLLQAQMVQLGIPIAELDLLDVLRTSAPLNLPAAELHDLRASVEEFLKDRDVLQLYQLVRRWPHFQWQLVIDRESQAAVLVIQTNTDATQPQLVAVKLTEFEAEHDARLMTVDQVSQVIIDRFLASRTRWLCRGATP